jgi:RimJ/RimL family protein N-acetyltransferase
MSEYKNSLGQPVGAPLPNWAPVPLPPRTPMTGEWCRLEPLNAEAHAEGLFKAFSADTSGHNWTYLPFGPFDDFQSFNVWCEGAAKLDDPLAHTIMDAKTGALLGVACLMRMAPAVGSIEVGGIHYSPALQRTPAATEAMYLMMRRAFEELGYRRYEWKCDSLNEPSRQAAKRLGFTYEGQFRQATVYKARNRDTDWFSILDSEWPDLKAAFEAWLDPGNFDAEGQQRHSLKARRD